MSRGRRARRWPRAAWSGSWRWPAGLAMALLPVGVVVAVALQERQGFPHSEHEGLFPLCIGCHQGVESGVEADVYPEPALCTGCHDGVEVERVVWSGPTPGLTNLTFEHLEHAREVAGAEDPALECSRCHAEPGAARMTVDTLRAERCLSCHGHPAEAHHEDAPCSVCHVPLAESGFPLGEIERIEAPADHEREAFVLEAHGELVEIEPSRCATCHTRELCLTCHVDADRAELSLVPAAPPGMELPVAEAHYPVPPSHQRPAFEEEHGELVEGGDPRQCATCHTREDCASCHLSPLPEAARALASGESVLAPGVGLLHAAPESHETPYFLRAHGTTAASEPDQCASCHTQPFCTECHDAPETPEFHDPDYAVRHAADAWNQNAECATCHNVQVFCRSCHLESGFGSEGRLGRGFHDAEPLWLLRHGQAARQSLESCASCHSQRDCLQCHSQLGAFRINPHGPDFDARRAWERNPVICSACHLRSPFGGGP